MVLFIPRSKAQGPLHRPQSVNVRGLVAGDPPMCSRDEGAGGRSKMESKKRQSYWQIERRIGPR